MRKAGVLNHSADIFKKNYKPESICERLERIGLKIVRTTQRSNRVCQRCVTIISRLERDLPVLMEWIEEEKELKEHAGERDGESTPFNNVTETPPPPPKKFRPDPSLPIPAPPATSTERSVTQVSVL